MNLLLKRDQTDANLFSLVPLRIGSGVTFTLLAELELDEEERALIQKYNFTKAILFSSDLIEDIKKAFRPALLLGILTFVVIWFIGPFSWAFGLAMLVTLGMTIVYFKTLREQIVVSELLDGGRKFLCDSIVDLIKKEAFLQHVSQYLRQILETAKHWDDREAIPIEPLSKDEAKQAVLQDSQRLHIIESSHLKDS